MKDSIEDVNLVEEANFTHDVRFLAINTVASLHYFRELAQELGIPVDLQPRHVIDDLTPLDRQTRELKHALHSYLPTRQPCLAKP